MSTTAPVPDNNHGRRTAGLIPAVHTPGPWEADTHRVFDAEDRFVALTRVDETRSDEENNANALMAAAAPELYAALVATRGQWIHSVNADLCLRALAKAEGGAR